MEPTPGQFVKVIFKNGLVEQGIVVVWTNKKAVLKSPSGYSQLIIQNTSEDILAIKIDTHRDHPAVPEKTELKHDAETPFMDGELNLKEYEPDPNLRFLKLAELKKELIHEEKERVRQHITTFKPSGTVTQYGLPRGIKKPPPIGTTKKNR